MEESISLAVGSIRAKADAHRAGFQGPGAFVGQWGAVEPRPHPKAQLRQLIRRLLAVLPGQEGHRARLVRPAKYRQPQLPKPPGTPLGLAVL